MIRWVFLDVGNILFDEDPLTFENFRIHVEAVRRVRPDPTFEGLLLERERRALAGSAWPLYEVISQYIDDQSCIEAWNEAKLQILTSYDRLSPELPGAAALIEALAGRCRLGLIANQGSECRRKLERIGWLDRFEVVAFSEEENAYKPDLELFRRAVERAGVEPGEAVMVGDRLDNDIAPAAALGMLTAWVRWPDRSAKGWLPESPEGLAYLRSLQRVASALADRPRDFEPTITADTLTELIPRLLELAAR